MLWAYGRLTPSQTPIVFVAHSMGGLVIKRALILACTRHEYRSLASSIEAMFFLATPHKGADLAQTLSRLLSLSSGNRPFLSDLHRQSLTIQNLNDEFPQYCGDVQLFSFYETLPMSLGVKKVRIVPKESAVLGLANERRVYLNANHRQVCKYESTADSNYRTVRNAIASVLEMIRARSSLLDEQFTKDLRRRLNVVMGFDEGPEDEIYGVVSQRMSGSCEWLLDRENFQDWLHHGTAPIYCITAKPGTGKTILSGVIITYLRKLQLPCSCHFFQYGNQKKSDISSFLLSMAWQMAVQDPELMRTCLDVYEKDEQLSQSNYRTIWRKLFVEGLLREGSRKTHFWIVDALDECSAEADLIQLLHKAGETSSIRIFWTSRNSPKVRQRLGVSNIQVIAEAIREEDTRSDIALYLDANMDNLPASSGKSRHQMAQRILEKSQGCFLWVTLVFDELKDAHTSRDVERILDEVPSDMNELFGRIVDTMSAQVQGKALAKAIITWTVCATRPLKTMELDEAVRLDLQDSIDNIEASIRSICGHLVYVDAQSYVQMVHQTARDFLLHAAVDSEFHIEEKRGHRRLLLTCLSFLTSDEMRSTQRRRNKDKENFTDRSLFVKYACELWFEHLFRLSWTDTEVVSSVAKFFNSPNVLSWIEYIARQSDLQRLVSAGKAIGSFIKGSEHSDSGDTRDIALLRVWANDLLRLVMRFGPSLAAYPASIFSIIPPFCPSETALRKKAPPRGITVSGLGEEEWGDQLSTIFNPQEQYSCIASSKRLFAIGCYSGLIYILQHVLYKEVAKLDHGEPVKLLQFGSQESVLVSVGFKTILVWDLNSKTQVRRFEAPQQCMALALSSRDEQLISATKDHCLRIWNLKKGEICETENWTQGMEATQLRLYRRPVTATFTMDAQLLAVIYKGQDILIWDLDNDSLYDIYNRESGAGDSQAQYRSSGVRCLTFGNGSSANLLAAAYADGELVLFDTVSGDIMHRTVTFAHILVCSPDGSMLASADPSGMVTLLKFSTLQPLHRIPAVEAGIQGLCFGGDGQQLLDIRGSRCRVWGPTVLLRQNAHSGPSSKASTPREANPEPSLAGSEPVLITSIVCHDNGDAFFCGKEDGAVYHYHADSGLQTSRLYSHANGVAIVSLSFHHSSNTLTSVDASGRVMVQELSSQGRAIVASKVLFDHRIDAVVSQVVCRPDLDRILICSTKSDSLWCLSQKVSNPIAIKTTQQRGSRGWVNHPLNRASLLLITQTAAHSFDWQDLKPLGPEAGIGLDAGISLNIVPRSIIPIFGGKSLAVMYGDIGHHLPQAKLAIWNTADLGPDSSAEVARPPKTYEYLSSRATQLIGALGSGGAERLVFLQEGNWISAIDSKTAHLRRIARHFFLPNDWLSMENHRDLMMEVTSRGNFLVVRRHEVAVIKRGLTRVEVDEEVPPDPAPAAAGIA